MITKENRLLLKAAYQNLLKNYTIAVQLMILTSPLEPDECRVYYFKSELMIQQYEGLWLHCCHIPGDVWRESWDATSRYIDSLDNWTKSLYQWNMDRIHKAIDVWRNMPDGTDKDQFLDRFVRDSCVNMAIIGTRFFCNTGKNVPDDMLKEIKRLGLSA